jgi:hypothetical protein
MEKNVCGLEMSSDCITKPNTILVIPNTKTGIAVTPSRDVKVSNLPLDCTIKLLCNLMTPEKLDTAYKNITALLAEDEVRPFDNHLKIETI